MLRTVVLLLVIHNLCAIILVLIAIILSAPPAYHALFKKVWLRLLELLWNLLLHLHLHLHLRFHLHLQLHLHLNFIHILRPVIQSYGSVILGWRRWMLQHLVLGLHDNRRLITRILPHRRIRALLGQVLFIVPALRGMPSGFVGLLLAQDHHLVDSSSGGTLWHHDYLIGVALRILLTVHVLCPIDWKLLWILLKGQLLMKRLSLLGLLLLKLLLVRERLLLGIDQLLVLWRMLLGALRACHLIPECLVWKLNLTILRLRLGRYLCVGPILIALSSSLLNCVVVLKP